MNEIVRPWKVTATAALVGFNAALAVGAAAWPTPVSAYVTSQSVPTFSFFEKSLAIASATTSHDFAQDIASIFATLSDGQEPLGAEFESIWDRNVGILYQS